MDCRTYQFWVLNLSDSTINNSYDVHLGHTLRHVSLAAGYLIL